MPNSRNTPTLRTYSAYERSRMYGSGSSSMGTSRSPIDDLTATAETLGGIRHEELETPEAIVTWNDTPPIPVGARAPVAQRVHRHSWSGDPSLLAEMDMCYRILRSFPTPSDRTERDIDDLIVALTEDVATVTEYVNFNPQGDVQGTNNYSAPF